MNRFLTIIGSLVAVLVVTLPARAQVDPFETPPLVFVIFDTSGSMSYTSEELHTPLCSVDANVPEEEDPADQRDPSVPYSFSRDMIAKEVLTGTFKNFWCRERIRPTGRFDEGYPIPWFTPEFSGQDVDGIIDINKERIKFGLATFDTVLGHQADQSGGWSTGPHASGLANVGLTNLGVMNESAPLGRLIIPSSADDFNSIINSNSELQDEILRAVPFGGTPISPSLEDTTWLLNNHKFLVKRSASNPQGDAYAKCRPRNVLLITDGRPNLGEGELGYGTSVEAAEGLFKNGYKVYVVGFNLDSGTQSIVHDIAEAGGTEKAHIANTAEELATELSEILAKATPGLHSRTDTVFTNITGSNTDLQYQINTAYSASPSSDIDLAGYAEVTAYRCEDGCRDELSGGAGACEITDIRKVLNSDSGSRQMYYVLDGKMEPFERDEPTLTADVMNIPTAGPLPEVVPHIAPDGTYQTSGRVLGDASDSNVREQFRRDLVDLMRAEPGSRRTKEKLGGIWHSTPVIQNNMSEIDVQIPSFIEYKNSIVDRPTMMYTVTTEGFVHAFHLSQPGTGTPTGVDWLDEVWAIAPQYAVERMQTLVTRQQVLTDGRAVLKDIRLRRSAADLTLSQELAQWRSVLVVPYRQGGRGMFAIDVTDPFKPFVRWEINHERRCWLDPDSSVYRCKLATEEDKSDYRNLGYTHAKPQIGTVFIDNEAGTAQEEVAAVFFPCGDGLDDGSEVGKCFMVARLDTGAKIKEFKNGDDSVVDTNGVVDNVLELDFDIIGDPAAYNTFIGTFVTRLFVGDEGGQLWRINVADTDPEKWKMSFFFDIYDDLDGSLMASPTRSPLKNAPSLSPLPQRGKLALVFGTGHLDYSTDLTQKTVVYSITESIELTTGNFTAEAPNWRRVLAKGENLTSRPIIFGNTAYFTSFEADPFDGCDGGTGRIWGLHYINSKGSQNPEPTFTVFDAEGSPLPDKVEYIELVDSIPYGSTIISRPACVGDQGIDAASAGGATSVTGGKSALQASKSGQIELVVQTGKLGATNDASKPAKGSATPAVNKFSQKLDRPPMQVISVSWGQVQQL